MDVEQFIELVRERPFLYDCKDPLHKNKKEKEKHWKEIAAEMEITSELAKTKWKNLKDNYNKHIKSTTPNGGSYVKYLHWGWASNMEFLKKHINQSTMTNDHSNLLDDHDTELVDSTHSSTKSEGRFEDIPIDTKRLQSLPTQQNHLTTTRDVIQYTDNEHANVYDGTDLIFLGYAKTIKAFSVKRQAEIKLRLAKIITEEELAQYEDNSSYPKSPGYYSNSPSPQNDPLNSKLTHEVQIKSEEY